MTPRSKKKGWTIAGVLGAAAAVMTLLLGYRGLEIDQLNTAKNIAANHAVTQDRLDDYGRDLEALKARQLSDERFFTQLALQTQQRRCSP